MGAILSKFWPNKSSNNNNNQPQLAIAGPPPRLPLPSPPPRPLPVTSSPVDKATAAGEEKSTNHGRKLSKKHQQQQQQQYKQQLEHHQIQQQSGQQFEKSPGKNVLPLSNQSFIYKTVFETTVSDANANEEEARINAAEAPGPFEIETDLLSPEIEEAVIKIQANVRGYLTRKQYRGVTPDRSVETSQQQPTPNVESGSQEPIESFTNQPKSSSGILAPPSSFSDTPKELPLDHDDKQIVANQGKEITEKLIEFSKQVNTQQAINQPLESTPEVVDDDIIVSKRVEKLDCGKSDLIVDCVNDELKSTCKNKQQHDESISCHRTLEVPSIETSGPEEAAIKIQAAFRGYQVRKTISRETSPCPTRESGGEDGTVGVHLRGKDFNSNQDSERESILVLDQLEECLSQELMRSSINLEDETSLSSYSTDIDLNASLQSNTSLMALISPSSSSSTTKPSHDEDNCDLKLVSFGSNDLLEKETITNNQLEKTTIKDEPSITTTIPDTIKSESVNNEQIVDTSPSDSSLISNLNQVPTDITTANRSVNQSVDCLTSTSFKEEDEIETIKTEPVLFIASDEKVNAIKGTIIVDDSLKTDQEIDPVIIVEVNGKLDASSNISKSNDQTINDLKSIELESTKESATSTTETIETKSESTQLIGDTTKFQVDCESTTTSLINETTPSSHLNQSTDEIEEPEIEPLFFDMISPLPGSTVDNLSNQQIVTNDNSVNVSEKFEQITSPIPNVQPSSSSSLPETVTNDQQSDLNESISAIDGPAHDSQQKVSKLIKEDSFGSDILILEDEKSDTLYDPFADDLTSPISSYVNQQQSTIAGGDDDDDEQLKISSTFVDDNLIKSVVDDINKDEGLLLYDSTTTINNNQTIDQPVELPDENITEVEDDILVNLDESDEEDDDSQKRPVDESINSNSTIRINIQRPSDAQEVEQLFQERSRDFDNSAKIVQSDEQLIGQSTEDIISREIISPSNVSQDEKAIQKSSDLESEKQLTDDNVNLPSIVENVQQSTINHDKSSIESEKISTNPFLNQPDFDSDIESDKINLNDQSLGDSSGGQSSSSNVTTEQPSQEEESTITSQQLESKVPKMEIAINKDDDSSGTIFSTDFSSSIKEDNQSKIPDESLIVVGTTDIKSTITNEPKDVEPPMKQKNEDGPSSSSEIQQLKSLIQDNLKETLIVTETESSNQSPADEKLTLLESSTGSAASSSTVNQPTVIIEPIDVGNVEQKVPTINESSVNDEPESKLEEEVDDASPSDANLLLQLQDRETRSKSPNPFGRRKRRPKKRGGANN